MMKKLLLIIIVILLAGGIYFVALKAMAVDRYHTAERVAWKDLALKELAAIKLGDTVKSCG